MTNSQNKENSNPNIVQRKNYECEKCHDSFESTYLLKVHKCVPVYYCDVCERHIKGKHNFVNHQHKTYKCRRCPKTFLSIKKKMEHAQNCTENCKCQFCGFTFENNVQRNSHKRSCKNKPN